MNAFQAIGAMLVFIGVLIILGDHKNIQQSMQKMPYHSARYYARHANKLHRYAVKCHIRSMYEEIAIAAKHNESSINWYHNTSCSAEAATYLRKKGFKVEAHYDDGSMRQTCKYIISWRDAK